MALQIAGTGPDPQEVAERIRGCIQEAMPDAQVEVTPASAGHYEIRVVSPAFEGRSRVQQQQAVYSAMGHLMRGKNPPVHAIDRMECLTP